MNKEHKKQEKKESEQGATMTDIDNIESIDESAQPDATQSETAAGPLEIEKDTLALENESLTAELNAQKDKLLRTVAEYDNYRKRTEREKAESANYGIASAVEKLLPALDALELATLADSTDEKYKKGVEMTLVMFQNALSQIGVEEIEAQDVKFNPNVHNAVAREACEDKESGTITRVLQKGYSLNGRVLRPSMVAVAE
ncbi:MAG: nucleotide exchange factor GrpE [Oscillospiraceae bacterium]